ncbi:MAG: hypothetical protein ACXW3S_04385, partial [Rhodoplanes sp.]
EPMPECLMRFRIAAHGLAPHKKPTIVVFNPDVEQTREMVGCASAPNRAALRKGSNPLISRTNDVWDGIRIGADGTPPIR